VTELVEIGPANAGAQVPEANLFWTRLTGFLDVFKPKIAGVVEAQCEHGQIPSERK
jgi:hypothetical protein